MTVFDNASFVLLADGWGELIGILALFAFYVIGAVIKKFSGSGEEPESETSYAVELAKKRAKERQAAAQQARLERARHQSSQTSVPQSEWDSVQEAKRKKLEQLRQRAKQPPAAARPVPKPVMQHPKFINMQQKTQEFLSRQAEKMQSAMMPPQQPKKQHRPPEVYTAAPEPPKRILNKIKQGKPEPVKMQAIPSGPLNMLLREPNELRKAIMLKEILDKPVALRKGWNFDSDV